MAAAHPRPHPNMAGARVDDWQRQLALEGRQTHGRRAAGVKGDDGVNGATGAWEGQGRVGVGVSGRVRARTRGRLPHPHAPL
eukprot:1261306-Prymnesium_polylepis.1